jgi:hypothetical protein
MRRGTTSTRYPPSQYPSPRRRLPPRRTSRRTDRVSGRDCHAERDPPARPTGTRPAALRTPTAVSRAKARQAPRRQECRRPASLDSHQGAIQASAERCATCRPRCGRCPSPDPARTTGCSSLPTPRCSDTTT